MVALHLEGEQIARVEVGGLAHPLGDRRPPPSGDSRHVHPFAPMLLTQTRGSTTLWHMVPLSEHDRNLREGQWTTEGDRQRQPNGSSVAWTMPSSAVPCGWAVAVFSFGAGALRHLRSGRPAEMGMKAA